MNLMYNTCGYIVVYGKSELGTGLVADGIQNQLRNYDMTSMIHHVKGTRYTKDVLEGELKRLNEWNAIIFRADSHDMIPRTDKQLFKVRVD